MSVCFEAPPTLLSVTCQTRGSNACLLVAARLGGLFLTFSVSIRNSITFTFFRAMGSEENGLPKEFGANIRSQFPLEEGMAYCNHAGYGMAPIDVIRARNELQAHVDACPDRYHLFEKEKMYIESLKKVSLVLKTDYRDMAFLTNDTTGLNTVLKSIKLAEGDHILINDETYSSGANAAREVTGQKVIKFKISFPIGSKQQIIDEYVQQLDKVQPRVRLAIIDHVTCYSGIVMPVRELAQACHQRGMEVLVDGAHAPGHIPLDVPALGVDYYVANLHKWTFVPRSCGILWVHPRHRERVRPLVTSLFYRQGFTREFYMQATRDDPNYMAAAHSVDFLLATLGGVEAITPYNHGLLEKAVAMLVREWGTEALDLAPEVRAPFFRVVRLPPSFPRHYALDGEGCERIIGHLLFQYRVVTNIKPLLGAHWVRVAAQVYNTMQDYTALKDAVLDMHQKHQQQQN